MTWSKFWLESSLAAVEHYLFDLMHPRCLHKKPKAGTKHMFLSSVRTAGSNCQISCLWHIINTETGPKQIMKVFWVSLCRPQPGRLLWILPKIAFPSISKYAGSAVSGWRRLAGWQEAASPSPNIWTRNRNIHMHKTYPNTYSNPLFSPLFLLQPRELSGSHPVRARNVKATLLKRAAFNSPTHFMRRGSFKSLK